jgi:hypothetical protein
VEAASGACPIPLGRAAHPRDGIVETLAAKWEAREESEKAATRLRRSTIDPGPESRGRRTPGLQRLVPLADALHQPRPRLAEPPYHRPENPLERGGGIWEWQWPGTKRSEAATRREWAKPRPWQGRHPVSARSRTGSHQGIALGKTAMPAVAARWKRDPPWPKSDMVSNPASTS